MIKEVWYDNFLDAIGKKYPKKTQLVQALMDLLFIEREAVYRRLRKSVLFSMSEVIKIAATWKISLDEVTGLNKEHISFQMHQLNYLDPSEKELNFLRSIVQSISYLRHFPDTEFMDICNKLSRQFFAGFPHLNQFYLFKWMHQYGVDSETIPYSKTIISEEKLKLTAEYYQAIKHVPNSNFILDKRLFDYLINDIRYFHSIYLITDEEKERIKNDLYNLLDYLLEVANKGCYPETQNRVNLYVSQLNIDTNYSYTFTPEAKICYIHVFEKYEIYTLNPEMVANFRTWMQLKKRTSIKISEVDEKTRIEFFSKQRQLVDGL